MFHSIRFFNLSCSFCYDLGFLTPPFPLRPVVPLPFCIISACPSHLLPIILSSSFPDTAMLFRLPRGNKLWPPQCFCVYSDLPVPKNPEPVQSAWVLSYFLALNYMLMSILWAHHHLFPAFHPVFTKMLKIRAALEAHLADHVPPCINTESLVQWPMHETVLNLKLLVMPSLSPTFSVSFCPCQMPKVTFQKNRRIDLTLTCSF